MGEVFFVRHGQASFGAEDYDKLSDLGHQQARWLGDYLARQHRPFDRVICGTMRRHVETAAGILAATGGQAEADPRLNEFDYDALAEALHLSTGAPKPHDRESFFDQIPELLHAWEQGHITQIEEAFEVFQTRVLAALADATQDGARVLVVTSGGPVSIAVRSVLGLDIPAMARLLLQIHNASYHRFKLEFGQLYLSQFNLIPHLETADRRFAQTYV